MTKRIIRCCPPALLFVALMFAAGIVQAQGTHTTGLPTTKTCPATAPDPPGTCYDCTFEITNADPQHGVRDLSVTDTAPFPSADPADTNPVACNQLGTDITTLGTNAGLGASGSGTESCSGTTTICPAFNCSGVNQFNQDRIQANGFDADTEQFADLPVDGGASNNTLVAPLVCDDNNICTTDSCSVETGCANAAIVCAADGLECTSDPLCDPAVPGSELCPNPNLADSTTCVDTDTNVCTQAGCEAGLCVQAHTTTTCTPDTNECTGPPVCDPTAGCQDPALADSTPCTEADSNVCTQPGCEAGACVQAHTTTTCTPDNNECTGPPVCDPTAGCQDPALADSAVCTDTDLDVCTVAGCEAGLCVQTHLPGDDPSCVPGEEICRTPGFFGSHGGTEKERSTNITLALLNAYNAANDPNLFICGREINNTDAGNVNSALEAICVSVKGDSRRQLARQLTAAALNCILTNAGDGVDACVSLTGAVCADVSVQGVFEACNTACAEGDVTATIDHDSDPTTAEVSISCIGAIDCFNNGGIFDPTDGSCDAAIESCHDRELDNGCTALSFTPPGPAGSPRECNEARKNDIYVPIPLP